jgi:hypothetical protein
MISKKKKVSNEQAKNSEKKHKEASLQKIPIFEEMIADAFVDNDTDTGLKSKSDLRMILGQLIIVMKKVRNGAKTYISKRFKVSYGFLRKGLIEATTGENIIDLHSHKDRISFLIENPADTRAFSQH